MLSVNSRHLHINTINYITYEYCKQERPNVRALGYARRCIKMSGQSAFELIDDKDSVVEVKDELTQKVSYDFIISQLLSKEDMTYILEGFREINVYTVHLLTIFKSGLYIMLI